MIADLQPVCSSILITEVDSGGDVVKFVAREVAMRKMAPSAPGELPVGTGRQSQV